jgi:hypothetical protein
VQAGRAIFHLDGKGKLASVELPARGTFTKRSGEKAPRTCLIVQAEIQPDGQTRYGIIESHQIRSIRSEELGEVVPIAQLRAKATQ